METDDTPNEECETILTEMSVRSRASPIAAPMNMEWYGWPADRAVPCLSLEVVYRSEDIIGDTACSQRVRRPVLPKDLKLKAATQYTFNELVAIRRRIRPASQQ